jgi:hypothetical protein
MDASLGTIGPLLLHGAATLLALALALGWLRFGAAAFALLAPRDAEAVPLLHVLAVATGLALGLGLLAAMPDAAAFRPSRIFAAESPWAIGIAGFLAEHALPRRAALAGLAAAMAEPAGLAGLAGWLAVAGLLAGLIMVLRLWQGRARGRAFGAFLLLALCTALLLHYGLNLLTWLAAQLGFWVFALALLLFQRWRYGLRAAH